MINLDVNKVDAVLFSLDDKPFPDWWSRYSPSGSASGLTIGKVVGSMSANVVCITVDR